MNLILLKLFLISWTVIKFEPIKIMLEYLPDKLFYNIIRLTLTCLQCFSFWLVLIYTQDLIQACLVSFVSFWWVKLITPYEDRIKIK